jgi:hypothetical protein
VPGKLLTRHTMLARHFGMIGIAPRRASIISPGREMTDRSPAAEPRPKREAAEKAAAQAHVWAYLRDSIAKLDRSEFAIRDGWVPKDAECLARAIELGWLKPHTKPTSTPTEDNGS